MMANQSASVRDRVDEDRAPDQPTQLRGRAWPAVFKRTFKEYKADNLPDLAAALTYYAVLAIFPMLIVLVSILGLLGNSVTQPLIDNLGKVAPGAAKDIFTSAIQNIQSNQGAARSSAWPARCGRRQATSVRLCARRTSSGTLRRVARSGRRFRYGLE
jgi:virulence factor BrkB